MLINVFINGVSYFFQKEISIIEACKVIGIKIPRFCYHESLSIAGNCRMCLVEIHDISKPVVSCSTDIIENMIIYTESPLILKARENILEFLLLNHPLDCPICDQAGECDLQDQALYFGSKVSRNYFNKRSVEDKYINNIIKTIMTRCIHCTRCVRFTEEICGIKTLGTFNRGINTEIGNYILKLSLSEISGNIIDLCPVGALTLKSNYFQLRPWEIQLIESIDLSDSYGSNIYLNYRGLDLFRVTPKKNSYINDNWITNKARFYFDFIITNYKLKFNNSYLKKNFNFKLPLLFLLNPDLDLNTLLFLKKLSFSNSKIFVKLLNTTSLKSNFNVWNNKLKINTIKKNLNYIFYFLTINLQIELPLLNVRIKSNLNTKLYGLNCFFNSNFPITFCHFCSNDIFFLINGSHFFFKLYNPNLTIFFFNKSFLNRVDSAFTNFFLLKDIKYYSISNFCNSEGANFLNFKKFNFKEFFIAKQVISLALDDTFILRKFLYNFSTFFWVNQFPANILEFLPQNSWIEIIVNQMPGFYLNLEQRVQKFALLKINFTKSLLNFLIQLKSFLKKKLINKKSKLLNSFYFFTKIFNFIELKEIFIFSKLLTNKIIKKFPPLFSSFLFFKNIPGKLSTEDFYRTSINLKFSKLLIESSQQLRLNTFLN